MHADAASSRSWRRTMAMSATIQMHVAGALTGMPQLPAHRLPSTAAHPPPGPQPAGKPWPRSAVDSSHALSTAPSPASKSSSPRRSAPDDRSRSRVLRGNSRAGIGAGCPGREATIAQDTADAPWKKSVVLKDAEMPPRAISRAATRMARRRTSPECGCEFRRAPSTR